MSQSPNRDAPPQVADLLATRLHRAGQPARCDRAVARCSAAAAIQCFKPWKHVSNQIPLDQGVTANVASPKDSPAVKALRAGWLQKKAQIFTGKLTKPDTEEPDTVNHLNWYLATDFKRPYPGESKIRPASDFNKPAPTTADLDD